MEILNSQQGPAPAAQYQGIGVHVISMLKAVGGYEFWFHREPDFRQFSKG
jgi:hypothetical protein